MLQHFPNQRQIIRGIALVICLCFWMGGTKVEAACGDHALLNGAMPAKQGTPSGNPLKHKRCSGFLCTNSSPLLPAAPNLAPERLMEKLVPTTVFQDQIQQISFVSFVDHCLVLNSSGHPGEILDPPRS